MKKFKVIAALCAAFVLCLALVGCGPNKDSYVGTWDLVSSGTVNEEEVPGLVYTEEDMESLRGTGLDIYLTMKDNGIAVLNILGSLTDGKWNANGGSGTIDFDQPGYVDPQSGETSDVNQAKISLSGDTLTMEKDNTKFTFKKGEYKDPYEAADAVDVADENGMSLIMTESEKMNPVTVVDNDSVSIVIDGRGVDSIGDPGYNVQFENKTTDTLNFWLPDPVKVGDTEVRCYTYITLSPGSSTTNFLQLDVEDVGHSEYKDLTDVSGSIQVVNAENGEVVGTYEFTV